VVRGDSEVCVVGDYEILVGGIFRNLYININISNGIIASTNFPGCSVSISPDGQRATVTNNDQDVPSGTIKVYWFRPTQMNTGSVSATVTYGTIFGNYSNSDQVNVTKINSNVSSIYGNNNIYCGTSSGYYGVSGAGITNYQWSGTNGITPTSQNSPNVTFSFANWQGNTAQISVIATGTCGDQYYRSFNIVRNINSSVSISGNSSVAAGSSYNTYTAMQNYQAFEGSNMTWSIYSSDTGWAVTDNYDGSATVTAPNKKNSQASLNFSAVNSCGITVYSSAMIVTGTELQIEKVIGKEEKDGEETINFTLYPNPSANEVRVLGLGKNIGALIVYDKLGQIVLRYENVQEGFTFNVAGLLADTYVAHLILQDKVHNFRLLVNHN
jgi:hypothetical protein